LIVEGIVEPMELAHLPYKKGTYEDYVGRVGLERAGKNAADRKSEGGFAEHFRRADANRDGALTRTEADKALPRLGTKFDRIDANGDGKLTQDELRRYFDSKRTARGKLPSP
jgi:Ca2+-binding EF-hand superfamily protein